MAWAYATVKQIKSSGMPLLIRPDGSGSNVTASFVIGAAPALNQRVLWDLVPDDDGYGQILVCSYTDVR